jgi:hypothetical protein
MPLKKITLKPGVNRENTRYTNEGGWYDCDKIRFRQGTPEKIGGWSPVTASAAYLGTARSLWPWTTNTSFPYLGVGTNLKYYIQSGDFYYDITPISTQTTVGAVTFAASNGSYTITVTDYSYSPHVDDFVTYSGAISLGGAITAAVLNKNYQVTSVLTSTTYTITSAVQANASDTGNGGFGVRWGAGGWGAGVWGQGSTVGYYEVPVGKSIQIPVVGWGAGGWGAGGWGTGDPSGAIRIWNAQNFGQDLIFGPKGGEMYYWNTTTGSPLSTRGVKLSSLTGASDTPLFQNLLLVSDTSRFVFAFGTNDYGSLTLDPMLIRWSDQESAANWTPAATNQAGSLRLSHGSAIIAVAQTRQEILVWTDTSLYSLQYVGAPIVWSSTLLTDNVSILSDRAWSTASGKTYWMGIDKFYVYEGATSTLVCDLRQYIFDDVPGINNGQNAQIFSSTVEKFNEVWWFYCSASSTMIDRYVVFNYTERLWYYGTIVRTAWIDSSVLSHLPIAADDTNKKLMYQEVGNDDLSTNSAVAITSYITSAEFDLDDGNNFSFIWRMLPDITFRGSSAASPAVTMYLLPLANSGSGYNNNTSTNSNQSVADQSSAGVTRIGTYPVEQFTGQVYTRVRGRQLSIKVESTALGVQWQLGAPRLDIRPDGRR